MQLTKQMMISQRTYFHLWGAGSCLFAEHAIQRLRFTHF